MGVDYFPCAHCKETVCDAGDYYRCENCRTVFCLDCKDTVIVRVRVDDDDDEDDSVVEEVDDDSDLESEGEIECILCTSDYTRRKISKTEVIQFLLELSPYKTFDEAAEALRARHTQ